MRKETIILKGKYTYPQPDQMIMVKQYMFVRGEDGSKQLMLRLVNDRNEICNGFSLMVYQYDAKGNMLGEEHFESAEGKQYKGGASFALEKIFKVKEKCSEVRVRVLWANFGDYTYQVESTGVSVVYEKGKETLAQMPAPRHGGARKVQLRRIRKPWTFALLGLLLLLVCFAGFLFMLREYMAEHDIFSLSGVQYEFVDPENKDGDVIVVGYKGVLGNMLLTSEIEGHTVVGVREGAFANNRLLREVRVEGIDIPVAAFSSCKYLQEVQLVGVKSVEKEAFFDCDALVTLESDGLEFLGENAFSDCERLQSVSLKHENKDAILTLGNYVFAQCTALERVSILQTILYPTEQAIFRSDVNITELHLRNYAYTLPNQPPVVNQTGKLIELFGNSRTQPRLSVLSIDCMDEMVEGFCAGFPELTSVTINESRVTHVGANAFKGATKLSSFSVPGHITHVGDNAFAGTAISFFDGNGLVEIGQSAFENCALLTQVTIPLLGRLEQIGERAFSGCASLQSISIPQGVSALEESTFSGCASLQTVQFADNEAISAIPSACFKGCESLVSISLPGALERIGDEAFRDCAMLDGIHLPQTVRIIGTSAFDGCASLSTVFVSGVEHIEPYAFANSGLVSVELPQSVQAIGFAALSGCHALEELTLPYLGPTANAPAREKYLSYVFGGETQSAEGVVPVSLHTFTLSGEVTQLEAYAFYDCAGLVTINLPSQVSTIGSYAFAKCSSLSAFSLEGMTIGTYVFYQSGLRSVVIPEGWSVIPAGTFGGCTALGSVTLPSTIQTLCSEAFAGCTTLSTVSFPDSLRQIDERAFANCTALQRVALPASMTTVGESAFANCRALSQLQLPTTLGQLGTGAFAQCISLTELLMPTTLGQLGNGAFAECSRLVRVEIPSALSELPANTFKNCTSLSQVALPMALRVIGENAFARCTSLSTLVLPASLSNIYIGAFSDCSSLCAVELPFGLQGIATRAFQNTALAAITVPETVSFIGQGAFSGCNSLGEITLPFVGESVGSGYSLGYIFEGTNTTLPQSLKRVAICGNNGLSIPANAFTSCYTVEEITLGEGVRSVGSYAFSNCPRLFYISLPSTLTSLSYDAFSQCYRLYEVENLSTLAIRNYIDCAVEIRTSHSARAAVVAQGQYRFARYNGMWYLIDYPANSTAIAPPASFQYEGDTVTGWAISNYLFYYNTTVQSVTLSGGVSAICKYAFFGCENLRSLTLGAGLSEVEPWAFSYCVALTTLTLPAGLDSIGESAFYHCYSLCEVSMGEGATAIGQNAFAECYDLLSVKLPAGLTGVGSNAFYGCTKLYDVYYTGTALSIRAGSTEHGCLARYAVVVHRNLSDAPSAEVTLANGMTMRYFGSEWLLVGYSGSAEALNLSELSYNGTSITSLRIRENVFAYNGYLKQLTLGPAVKQIQAGAFAYCSALTVVHGADAALGEIEARTFSGCSRLQSAALNNAVSRIGDEAFYECKLLLSIDMPDALQTIGERAFWGCRKLLSITIPQGVNSIGYRAFYNCLQLFEVYDLSTALDVSDTQDYDYAAYYSKAIYTSTQDSLTRFERDGCHFIKAGDYWYLYHYENENATELLSIYNIGNRLVILPNAFVYSTISSVRLPECIISIQNGAFADVSGLSVVYYEGTSEELGEVLNGQYLTGSYYGDSAITMYYRGQNGCVHGAQQWGEHGGVIFTTRCELVWAQTSAPTCTSQGEKIGVCGCPSCDYYETQSVPMLAHEFENGACIHCERVCEQLTQEKLQAMQEANVVSPLTSFGVEGGTFFSQNKENNSKASFTVTATEKMTVIFTYSVSSERGYDKLIVSVNGEQRLDASGERTGTESYELAAGQTIEFSYTKDSSTQAGSDTAYIRNLYFLYYN